MGGDGHSSGGGSPGNKSAPDYPQRIRLRVLIGKMMGIFLNEIEKANKRRVAFFRDRL